MNWTRRNVPPRTAAVVLIVSVFARPGNALDQEVAAGDEADEHAFQHLVLAGDHALDLDERLLQLAAVVDGRRRRRISGVDIGPPCWLASALERSVDGRRCDADESPR